MTKDTKRKVRIGFIGAGQMGQAAHLRNYASLTDECEVVALAELRSDLGQKVADRYAIPKVYPNYEELLAHEKVDALVASQPFTRHGILLTELAKSGLPLMSEKPIASSVTVAEKIIESLEVNQTWLMVGYHKRCDPATIYAKAEIDRLKQTGELGPLRYVRISMPPGDWIAGGFNDNIQGRDQAAALEEDPAASDMDKATRGHYQGFVNYYIHQVNLLRHIFGEDYRVRHADPAQVLFVAESQSGKSGLIEMNPFRTTIRWQETVLAAFEKGYVEIELPAPLAYNQPGRVTLFRDPGDGTPPMTLSPDLPWIHAMRNQALAFIRAVRGEAPAPCLADEALKDLQVARDYIRLLKGV